MQGGSQLSSFNDLLEKHNGYQYIRDSPASHVANGTSVNFRTIKMEVLYLYFGGTFPKIGADIALYMVGTSISVSEIAIDALSRSTEATVKKRRYHRSCYQFPS